MRPLLIVFDSPSLDFAARVVERDEDVFVQTFLSQAAVEAIDEEVLDRLSRLDELQLHATLVGPLIEYPPGKFRTIVGLDHGRQSEPASQSFQHPLHPLAGERDVNLDSQALPTPLVDYC